MGEVCCCRRRTGGDAALPAAGRRRRGRISGGALRSFGSQLAAAAAASQTHAQLGGEQLAQRGAQLQGGHHGDCRPRDEPAQGQVRYQR